MNLTEDPASISILSVDSHNLLYEIDKPSMIKSY